MDNLGRLVGLAAAGYWLYSGEWWKLVRAGWTRRYHLVDAIDP